MNHESERKCKCSPLETQNISKASMKALQYIPRHYHNRNSHFGNALSLYPRYKKAKCLKQNHFPIKFFKDSANNLARIFPRPLSLPAIPFRQQSIKGKPHTCRCVVASAAPPSTRVIQLIDWSHNTLGRPVRWSAGLYGPLYWVVC